MVFYLFLVTVYFSHSRVSVSFCQTSPLNPFNSVQMYFFLIHCLQPNCPSQSYNSNIFKVGRFRLRGGGRRSNSSYGNAKRGCDFLNWLGSTSSQGDGEGHFLRSDFVFGCEKRRYHSEIAADESRQNCR